MNLAKLHTEQSEAEGEKEALQAERMHYPPGQYAGSDYTDRECHQ
jgi:hypothetical protein